MCGTRGITIKAIIPGSLLVALFITTPSFGDGGFPATGQTTSFRAGDDGAIQAGAPLRFKDNGDGTITDKNTALVWEKLSADGSVHDGNNLYTWEQAFDGHVATLNRTRFAGHADWRVPNVRELQSIVNYGAFRPAVSAAFNTGCTTGCTVRTCSCTGASNWSSTTFAPDPTVAWVVFVGGGNVNGDFKNDSTGVRAVRGGCRTNRSCCSGVCTAHVCGPRTTKCQALPATGQTTCWDSSGTVISCTGTGQDGDIKAGAPLSYTDNGDGTITDNNTGLVWEKLSADGSVHSVGNFYTWDQAFDVHVATLNSTRFAGHADWRVPNVRELQSIVNYGGFGPAVSAAFTTRCRAGCTPTSCSCTATSRYWSSTTFAPDPTVAWGVGFSEGDVGGDVKGDSNVVQAVQGGDDPQR